MHKLKSFLDFEKEEAWLRHMAKEGWAFQHRTAFGYAFERADPRERTYRIDYRTFRGRADFDDYVLLFQDAGWRHVWGSTCSGYQYFEAHDACPNSDIFSDNASRAGRYRAIMNQSLPMLAVFLCLIASAAANGGFDFETLADPAALYFTPGLWERSGASFWIGFLIETPFVLMRNYWWTVAVAGLAINVFCIVMLFRLGRRAG